MKRGNSITGWFFSDRHSAAPRLPSWDGATSKKHPWPPYRHRRRHRKKLCRLQCRRSMRTRFAEFRQSNRTHLVVDVVHLFLEIPALGGIHRAQLHDRRARLSTVIVGCHPGPGRRQLLLVHPVLSLDGADVPGYCLASVSLCHGRPRRVVLPVEFFSVPGSRPSLVACSMCSNDGRTPSIRSRIGAATSGFGCLRRPCWDLRRSPPLSFR